MPPKKEKPKEKSPGWNFDPVEGFVVLIFLAAFFVALDKILTNFLFFENLSFYGFDLSKIADFFKNHADFFKTLGFSIAGGAAVGTFAYNKMADGIWRIEKAKLYPENMSVQSEQPAKSQIETKWERILRLSESGNQSDWRLAIIEADIILDELLEKLQLPGDTMGDKLKAVEPSDFLSIDNAWEAHKFRNMIAHEGGDFLVNQHEIRRIISLYESVFKEFSLI